MILSRQELIWEWEHGAIGFHPKIEKEQIGDSSIDLRLDPMILVAEVRKGISLDLRLADSIDFRAFGDWEQCSEDKPVKLKPRQFALGYTYEHLSMPSHLRAEIQARSHHAQLGLQIHLSAPHIHPRWNGKIILEIVNHNTVTLELYPKDKVCQVIFHRMSRPLD